MENLIIKLLFEGKTQPEIAKELKAKGIKPNSLSSVEKKLKLIKAMHKAKTMFHLGVILSNKQNGKSSK